MVICCSFQLCGTIHPSFGVLPSCRARDFAHCALIQNRQSKIANRDTPWCNGNTAPFGGVILGSNPSGVAKQTSSNFRRASDMQTNWRKYSSRPIAYENALKRSLFVNSFDGRHAILVAEVDPAAAPLFTVPSWKSFAW